MPPDVSGPGRAAGGAPVPPSAPVRPVSPSRALVPAEKVGARTSPPFGSPLHRSGVALADLLFAPDLLETRQAVAPVALEMGLESARGQLLRQLPGDALVTLDAIWPGAQTTEEGWYLRAGALTVLGHPVEGERVAASGLDAQPLSLALRLMQSVARVLLGDLSGARAALTPALDAAPGAPVLVAQQAVILARQGHADDASALLDTLALAAPDHPALAWARAAARTSRADRVRSSARPIADSSADTATYGAMEETSASEVRRGIDTNTYGNLDGDIDADVDAAALLDELARLPEGPDDDGDIVTSAFSRLGRRLVVLSDSELTMVARTLLRACSTGGAMASACLPEDAHAARQVLTALLVVARKDTAAPTPLGTLMSQFLPRLREGATDDAARVLRRTAPSIPTPVRRLLEVLLDGATRAARSDDDSPAVRAKAGGNRPPGGTGEYAIVSPAEQDAGPLVPVRLGLSLLAETAVSRARERSQVIEDRVVSPTDPERSGEGWGAARAAWHVEGTRNLPESRPGAALPVILCVAGAVGSAMNGAAIIAGVLAVAALLLATRRAPNRND